MGIITNASPASILLGANDLGARTLPAQQVQVGQHVPLIFTFAKKGTVKKTFGGGAEAILQYGAETFNPDFPYYKHTNKLAALISGAGGSCVYKRLVPTDAGPKANVVTYVDVLQTNIPNYVRDSLGNKVIDPVTNAFIVDAVTPTVPGVRLKYIAELSTVTTGTAAAKTGTMSVTVAGVTTNSTMYPVLERRASEQGMHYNNLGISIESPTVSSVDTALLTAAKALPYKLLLTERVDANSPGKVVPSLFGEPAVEFTLKPNVKHPVTKLSTALPTVFATNWFNETNPLMPTRYNDSEPLHVYTAELETVFALIMANEAAHITTVSQTWHDGLTATTLSWFDFSSAVPATLATEHYLINIFTGKAVSGANYFTVEMDTSTPTLTGTQREVHISRDTPVYMSGGADGTVTDAVLEQLVQVEMAKYLDPNSEYMDTAVNLETALYDSGFSVPTKDVLPNFIAVRKNTVVALGTRSYLDGNRIMPLSEVRAIAVALKTRGKMFPESVYFGTPTGRMIIMAGDFILHSDVSNQRVPHTFDLAIKTTRMMGAGDFKWRAVHMFDHGTGAELSSGHSYQPEFIPAGVKPTLWNDGLVWAQPKFRQTYFIPAYQTIYGNDTSPMNSWVTACAVAALNTIADQSWREFSGTSGMSDVVFIETGTNYLHGRINGIFAGVCVVVPEVIIDAADAQRGYSWQVVFNLYTATMKTKMVAYTNVYRLNSLPA